jgi:hypothetical protein
LLFIRSKYNPLAREKAVPPDEDFFLSEEDAARLRTEQRGFAPDQMVRCEKCLRANPPTRTSCLYCAATLPVTEHSARLRKPTLRPLERWEQGFNSILIPRSNARPDEGCLNEIASLLRLSLDEVRRIVEGGEPLPIARAAAAEEAQLIERSLQALGLEVLTVSDDELALETQPPRRMRTLELAEDVLVAWPAGSNETLRASWDEITLLLTGRTVTRQVEVEERRGRRAENEITETRELSTDDAVLDIYASGFGGNWRILASSFDFSCLNEKKSLLVAQNFVKLLEELRGRASRAEYDDSYARVRHALKAIWPLEQQTESRGWRRGGPGRYSTEVVTTTDNESQFTRYSRLRHYLKFGRAETNL